MNGKTFCFDCSPSGAQERAAEQACRRKESASARLQNPLGRIARNTPIGSPAVTERRKSSRRLLPQTSPAGSMGGAAGASTTAGVPPATIPSHPTIVAASAGGAPSGGPAGAHGAWEGTDAGCGTAAAPEAGGAPKRRSSVRLAAQKMGSGTSTGPASAQAHAAIRISARHRSPVARTINIMGIAWLIAISAAVAMGIVLVVAIAIRKTTPSPPKHKARTTPSSPARSLSPPPAPVR